MGERPAKGADRSRNQAAREEAAVGDAIKTGCMAKDRRSRFCFVRYFAGSVAIISGTVTKLNPSPL
jgi:hypothetical protein